MGRETVTASLLLAGALAVSSAWGQEVPPLVDPPLGPQIVVSETPPSSLAYPSVAFGPEGTYMAVWTSGTGSSISGRILDRRGAPLGSEFQIVAGDSNFGLARVAAGGGGFAVVWFNQGGLFFRRFDGHGQPLSPAVRLDVTGQIGDCDVAVNDAGDAVAVWNANGIVGQVFARRVSAGGTLGTIQALTSSGTGSTRTRVAAAPDGGFLALWDPTPPFPAVLVMAERMDAAGNWGLPFQANENPAPGFFVAPDVRPLFRPDGGFSILWRRGLFQIQLPIPFVVRARNFDATGNTLTPEIAVNFPGSALIDAARAPNGNTLIFTADTSAGAFGRAFDGAWSAATRTLVFQPGTGMFAVPAVAVDPAGDFLALWAPAPKDAPPHSSSVLGRTLAATTCAPGSEILCLGAGGRFRAKVAWKNPFNGDTGTGHTRPLSSDSGAFWFFGDQNLELAVKVLDGTSINGHFWVYGGSLSNVEYTVTVTDLVTRMERSYHNPPFQFASLADVEAFPGAGTLGVGPEGTAGTATADATADAVPTIAGHFTVGVRFTDPRTGTPGPATAVPLTSDTVAFWFFGSQNLELMVKVLDGRAINGKFWVFFGALSDVDYTLTVTDTETGRQRMYHNPRGTLASVGDTEAF